MIGSSHFLGVGLLLLLLLLFQFLLLPILNRKVCWGVKMEGMVAWIWEKTKNHWEASRKTQEQKSAQQTSCISPGLLGLKAWGFQLTVDSWDPFPLQVGMMKSSPIPGSDFHGRNLPSWGFAASCACATRSLRCLPGDGTVDWCVVRWKGCGDFFISGHLNGTQFGGNQRMQIYGDFVGFTGHFSLALQTSKLRRWWKFHGQLFWRRISKNKISIWLHSDICFFFFESNLPFNLEHLKTLQKGVASQRHSPKNARTFVQLSPILRWCATSCVDVWNRPWRWFGTWCKLRILEANAVKRGWSEVQTKWS